LIAVVAGAALAGLLATACGTTDEASRVTLPPMRTTTSSTSPPTTTLPESQRFYTIQRGDTLGIIAERNGVTVLSIVELNGLANPDDIQAGQTIEIPAGGTPPSTVEPVAPEATPG
jgi:LysM repeat protein